MSCYSFKSYNQLCPIASMTTKAGSQEHSLSYWIKYSLTTTFKLIKVNNKHKYLKLFLRSVNDNMLWYLAYSTDLVVYGLNS